MRLTRVYEIAFGAIGAADIAVDGTPVRTLEVWIEAFELLHDGAVAR